MENVKKNNLNILQQRYKDLCRSVNTQWIPTKKEPKYPIIEENEEEVDVSQLQALITTKIEEFGGSGHIDTLLECALTMFRHTGTKPSEMTKIIKDILVKNTDIYMEKEPTSMKGVYWLTDKERERRKSSMRKWKRLKIGESIYYNFDRKNESLREILFGAITKMGPIPLNKLSDISKVNWDFPFSNMNILSLRDLVNLILTTDPVFEEDVGNPTLWTISKKHKKNISKFVNTNLKLPSKEDFYMSPLDDVYLCKCGVKLDGPMDTWKKGPSGEFLCSNCCETKVVVEEGTKTESPSEDNPWIQCDKCGSWIIASSDGIHDLSIYDDSNPNHLDYYCPKCREKDGLDAPHLNFDDEEDDDEEKDDIPVNTKVKQETHSRHDSCDSDMDEFEEKVEVKEKPTKRVTRKRRKSYSEDN